MLIKCSVLALSSERKHVLYAHGCTGLRYPYRYYALVRQSPMRICVACVFMGLAQRICSLNIPDDDPESLYIIISCIHARRHQCAEGEAAAPVATRAMQTYKASLYNKSTSRRAIVGKASSSQPRRPRFFSLSLFLCTLKEIVVLSH